MIDPKESVIKTREKYPHRTIYIRDMVPKENPEKDIPVMLGNTVYHIYYEDESYRKSVVDKRLFFIRREMTLK